MGLALIAFLIGLPRYRIYTAQGSSALLEIFRVRRELPVSSSYSFFFRRESNRQYVQC
jgi:hypothetical protein